MPEPISASAITLLTPLPGRVILQRTEPASAPSAYVIPDSAKEKPTEAEVVAIPSVVYYEYGVQLTCPFNVGDLVLVGKYSGDYDFRGEKVCIVRWDEVLAVISKPANREQVGVAFPIDKTDEYDEKVDEKKPPQSDYRAVPRLKE